MKTVFKTVHFFILALFFTTNSFSQNSTFESENKRFIGTKSGTNYPWTLTARTGLIDDFCTAFMNCKDVDTVQREKIDQWYISENFKGYWEYLPDDYNNPQNSLKTYPLIIYIAGCGVPGDGRFYLTANKGLDRSKGIGRVLSDPLPAYLSQNPRYFSNVAIKKLGTQPAVTGDKAQFIVLMVQSSGPNRCLPYSYPKPDDMDSCIERAVKSYRVDRTRIYLTGVSGGGEVIYHYPATKDEFARKVTAIAPVSSTGWLMGPRAEEYANRIVQNGVSVLGICNTQDFTMSGLTFKFNRLTMLNILNAPGLLPYQADTVFFTYPNQTLGVSNHDAHRRGYYPNISPYYPIHDFGGPLWTDKATGEHFNLYEWFLTKSKAIILPYNNLDFRVTQRNTDIVIRWNSQDTDTLLHYTVERSTDGSRFETVESITAANRTNENKTFLVYDHAAPQTAYLYYRLKVKSRSGNVDYSKTIRLHNRPQSLFKVSYEQGVNGLVTIRLPQKANISINLLDMYGRVLRAESHRSAQIIHINIANERAGTYILQVMSKEYNTEVFKVIKQ